MSSRECPECGFANSRSVDICAICRADLSPKVFGAAGESPLVGGRPSEDADGQPPVRAAAEETSPSGPSLASPALILIAGLTLAVAVGTGYLAWNNRVADPAVLEEETSEPFPQPSEGETVPSAEVTPSGGGTTFSEEPTPSPSGPSSVGVVVIDQAVGDPRAASVAATFDRYFSGINSRDYASAASVFDPRGKVLDPDNPKAVDKFGQSLATTQDSNIVLHSVVDAAPPAVVLAHLTFQSEQQPGYGPKGREQETCTLWSIRYELSTAADGSYRIMRGRADPSRACPS